MGSKKIGLLYLILGLTSILQAQTAAGIRFVAIPFAPEAVAWTEGSAARGGAPFSAYTNPALAAFAKDGKASVIQNIWPGVQSTSFMGVALPSGKSVFTFSLLSNLIEELEARTVPGDPAGLFSARYTAVSAGWSKRIKNVSAGISGSYLNESIYEANASGWSFSAGLAASFLENRLLVGTSLLHAGKMSELRAVRSELPTRWQTGIWVDAIELTQEQTSLFPVLVSFKTDVIVPLDSPDGLTLPSDDSPVFSAGTEITFDEQFFLRGGWNSRESTRPWSVGSGVKIGKWQADYAITRQQSGFGTVHSIGITMDF